MEEQKSKSVFSLSYWLETRVRLITMVFGMIPAAIGAMVAWDSADLPRLAYKSEVVEVRSELMQIQQFSESTRLLLLNGDWFRLSAELKEKRERLKKDPFNGDLINEVTRLEQSLHEIEDQIQRLKNKQTKR